jgi:hypothetical protein
MKKYIATLFALALAIGSITFVGCGGEPAEDPKKDDAGEDTGGAEMTEEEKKMKEKMGFVTGKGSDTNTPTGKPKDK